MTDRKEIERRLRAAVEAGCGSELAHLVSAEAARRAGQGLGPSPLVEALLEMGRPDLAPLAAELHSHAAAGIARDARQELIAGRSPVFEGGEMVVAMPVGDPQDEARGRIIDRLLALLLRSGHRRARLILDFADGEARAPAAWSALARDLEEQGILFEVILSSR
ncbi:MAG TPA: hypothetical protein VM285_16010 [Polyangia bacterium]|nr:hypothetical protein [Polyangia bacterium]